MPYIVKEVRPQIDKQLGKLFLELSKRGEYNYAITRIMHQFIEKYTKTDFTQHYTGAVTYGLCYDAINDAIGILECAKQEFYRMVAASYEDKKKTENGHISELDKEG